MVKKEYDVDLVLLGRLARKRKGTTYGEKGIKKPGVSQWQVLIGWFYLQFSCISTVQGRNRSNNLGFSRKSCWDYFSNRHVRCFRQSNDYSSAAKPLAR